MNKSVFFFVLSFLIGSYSVCAQKSTRIAYVDMQYILDHMDEYKVASEQLSQKVAQWEKEIKEKQGEMTQRKETRGAE